MDQISEKISFKFNQKQISIHFCKIYIMLIHTASLLFWTFYCCTILINAAETDLSMLTDNQTQVWFEAIAQINNRPQDVRIEIVHFGQRIDIPLYNDQDNVTVENRHLFKQNINKRVDWYLYENQLSSSIPSNIYDRCHGKLSSGEIQRNLAGIYVYTSNQTSYGLGIILVEVSKSFQWFNESNIHLFDKELNVKNGTTFSLAFETSIYYNSNSDLISYNKRIEDIIEESNISINNENQNNNLQTFLTMENLSCQRHYHIVYDDLRVLTFACVTQVTFKCPLQIGSTCWLEDKKISNIQLNINSLAFVNNNIITVRIDV
jgi:hypothetical protein